MSLIPLAVGNAGAAPKFSLMTSITDASLTTGLQFCLDAGVAASYTSGDKWLDLSGNGQDWQMGTSVGSDSEDPAFTGSVGNLSSSTYFLADGTSRFEYDTTNETWMANLHNDGAKFAWLWIHYPTDGNRDEMFDTRGSVDPGVDVRNNTSNKQEFLARKSGATRASAVADNAGPTGEWVFQAGAIDEAAGSGNSFFYLNGNYDQVSSANTFDATYASTNSGTAASMTIGWEWNASGDSGYRWGAIAMWSSTIPSKANFDTLYAATQSRFGF